MRLHIPTFVAMIASGAALLACSGNFDAGSGPRPGGAVAPGQDAATEPKNDGGTTSGDAGADVRLPTGPSVLITPQNGENVIDLGQANSALQGAKMSFNVSLSLPFGTVSGKAYIDSVEIDTDSTSGVRLYQPAFLLEKPNGGFLGSMRFNDVDLSVPKSRKSPFPESNIVVDRYEPDAKLRVAFTAIAPSAATAIEGLPASRYVECEAPQLFVPAVTRHYKPTCQGCHGDLFPLGFLGRDDKTACGMSKTLLAPSGPNLLRPTQAGHAGGIMPEASAYTQAINAWRNAED